jgi:hypothetical protein
MLVCLSSNSDVLFEASQLQGNAIRPITTLSPSVRLHVRNSTFTDNHLLRGPDGEELDGGALLISNGTALVESSKLSASANTVPSYGGGGSCSGELSNNK